MVPGHLYSNLFQHQNNDRARNKIPKLGCFYPLTIPLKTITSYIFRQLILARTMLIEERSRVSTYKKESLVNMISQSFGKAANKSLFPSNDKSKSSPSFSLSAENSASDFPLSKRDDNFQKKHFSDLLLQKDVKTSEPKRKEDRPLHVPFSKKEKKDHIKTRDSNTPSPISERTKPKDSQKLDRSQKPHSNPAETRENSRTESNHLAKKETPTEKTDNVKKDNIKEDDSTISSITKTDNDSLKKEVKDTFQSPYESKEELYEDIPILAFLTGQLDRLNPQEIPKLVTGNEFVSDCLGSTTIQNFLSTPQPLGKLVKEMGMGDQFLNKLQSLNVDLNAVVAPSDILKSLNIDPGVVASEFTMLKANLQLEGLTPYIERCSVMSTHVSNKNIDRDIKDDTVSTDLDILPNTVEDMPLNKFNGNTPDNIISNLKNIVPQSSPENSAINIKNSEQPLPFVSTDPQNIDPFESLGSKMNPTNTISLDMQSNAKESLTPLQMEESIVSTEKILNSNITNLNNNSTSSQTNLNQNLLDSNSNQNQMISPSINSVMQQEAGQKPQSEKLTNVNTSNKFSSDVITNLNVKNSSSNSKDNNQNSNQQSNQQNRLETLNIAAQNSSNINTSPSTSIFTVDAKNQTIIGNSIIDKVIEKSNMLIKEGGGSIRVDLGTKDLGKLDLAIDLSNDKLNLRIIAPSEKVREIIVSELNTLKENLMDQNLDLSNVEVGVGGGQSWSHQDDQGGFHSGEYYEEHTENISQNNKFSQKSHFSKKSSFTSTQGGKSGNNSIQVLI